MKVLVLRVDCGEEVRCPMCHVPLGAHSLQFKGGVGVCTDCAYWIDRNNQHPPTSILDKARHPEDWRRWKGLSLWCPKPHYKRTPAPAGQGYADPGAATMFCVNCGKVAIPPGTPNMLCLHCSLP